VSQTGDGPIEHYDRLGFVVAGATATTVVLMFKINRMVTGQVASGLPAPRAVGVADATPEA
jgi:hypothetical protein